MATTITPTKKKGVMNVGGWYEAIYSCVADTTTAAGLLTMDVTDDFYEVWGMEVVAFEGAEVEEILKPLTPAWGTAATATNVGFYVYDEALASIDSTDVSATLGTFHVKVMGSRAKS